jgi:hypothetical protein
MAKRICRYCGVPKPLIEFEIANVIKGKEYRRWKCDTCYVARKAERRREIRQWLNDLKGTMKCERCPVTDFRCLDFHHHSDDKEFNIGNAVRFGMARETILTEIAKCEVICSNCHRIETWQRKNGV